jgi:hypothetical protein
VQIVQVLRAVLEKNADRFLFRLANQRRIDGRSRTRRRTTTARSCRSDSRSSSAASPSSRSVRPPKPK